MKKEQGGKRRMKEQGGKSKDEGLLSLFRDPSFRTG